MAITYKSSVNEDTAYCDGHKVQLVAEPTGILETSDSVNNDYGYIKDNNGKKHRVLLVSFVSGTIDYKSSITEDTAYTTISTKKVKVKLVVKETGVLTLSNLPNINKGYVIGTDNKKHRVLLVKEITGTLQLPNSETSDTAYITDSNNKKHKVHLIADIS